ncbi:MAG: TetR/AcrR family transcriptional regulator [Bacteroidales bacterium]|nr:TetR/AcrR family transcriptional regulator [Bacteroidales bacterium]
MYRVKDDKRVQTSVQRIFDGLDACLDSKNFNDISVSDISTAAGISRATFYRLFDSPSDILAYICDQLVIGNVRNYLDSSISSIHEFRIRLVDYWLDRYDLVNIILKSQRDDLLFNAVWKFSGDSTINRSGYLTPAEMDYVKAVTFALMRSILMVYGQHGRKERADDILALFYKVGDKL